MADRIDHRSDLHGGDQTRAGGEQAHPRAGPGLSGVGVLVIRGRGGYFTDLVADLVDTSSRRRSANARP